MWNERSSTEDSKIFIQIMTFIVKYVAINWGVVGLSTTGPIPSIVRLVQRKPSDSFFLFLQILQLLEMIELFNQQTVYKIHKHTNKD